MQASHPWLRHAGQDPFRARMFCVKWSRSWCPAPSLSTVRRARCPGCLFGRPGIEAPYLLMTKVEEPRALLPKPLWSPGTVGDLDPPVQPLLESVGLAPGQAYVTRGTFSLSAGPHFQPGLVPKGRAQDSFSDFQGPNIANRMGTSSV